MKTATLYNKVTGTSVPVYTTTEHPDSHCGIPVWADDEDNAYLQVGLEHLNPFYELRDIRTVVDIARVVKAHHLTQSECARRMGISASTLKGFLAPGANVRLDTLSRIADALDCEVWELLT